MSFEITPSFGEDNWINEFLTEKSHLSLQDESISTLALNILTYTTLKYLVRERYEAGNYFLGWTQNGSKGFTEVDTGNIRIKQTEIDVELFTLGYECVNSRNRKKYIKIGIKYAFEEKTPENREKFAREILGVEAEAMLVKCKLATELEKRHLVQSHYLEIFDDESLKDSEKIIKLTEKMIEKGVVYGGVKSAYKFYQEERYDEFVDHYKKEIQKGNFI